ncbi:small GTP-binding and elongation factor Tu GTP binding domain containing protein, putative [Babesia bigemina]|uniref:Small GTP-binding and elongation factor Tu GTP binding domain containing protein, putative n=1 Tax=Babesia bigemina TaxID=5866 RepID=A0A061DAV4_BABBI|nr:small GTP-binding and elongation factor Tu GTP binding domain containing protein, putative [Babesia bigemina]CDR97688.1 small GTP-binding and elongation factor Tu GTP binding domain containing protein, putative [Babesia bigemina]|eukprot:XP_012769874.1 small GTP-binding and elongation factor Tu GTP binding domain containing protein, putative [Babesia bigemina]
MTARNKRNVLVPFESAAVASRAFGFQAIRVSPEPPTPQRCVTPNALPVLAIVGHKDHGKTTLMERLTGERMVAKEPGDTTQQVVVREATIPTGGEPLHATLLDTPGDELFEVVRGRAIHIADAAVVVMSAEGGEAQTRDAILQADRFKVPVVFCINKADLEFSDAQVAIAELRAQCARMHKAGIIGSDLADCVDNAVAVSARTGACLPELGAEIARRLSKVTLPTNPVFLTDVFGGVKLGRVENFIRRTNCLVSSGAPPIAVCFVLELERTHSFGVVMTVAVRHGVLIEGCYFVAGTEYGRVSGIYPPHGRVAPDTKMERAAVGRTVRVTGLKTVEGTSADDLLLVLPQHEAFRLSQYRREVQLLRSQQVEGPPLEVPWAVLLQPKEDAGYGASSDSHCAPEKSEFGSTENRSGAATATHDDAFPSTSIYLHPVEDTVSDNGDIVVETDYEACDQTHSDYSESGQQATPTEDGGGGDDYNEVDELVEEEEAGCDPSGEADASPHEMWASKVEEQNKALLERWRSKLPPPPTKSKTPKAHGGIEPPAVTPEMGRPVIPVILRANFVGTFDALLDGFEALEKKHRVRIPVVHGGLGSVSPNDIVQADIGNKFGHCPVYAFQVPVLNDAIKHAVINHVTVKQFNVYSDLLADVERRCEGAVRRLEEKRSRELLRR